MHIAGPDISGAYGTVIQIALVIQELGQNWYRASIQWKDFPRQVEGLKRTHGFWKDQIQKYGLSSERDLITALHEAESLLRQEQAKLVNRERACVARCFFKMNGMWFPEELGQSIVRATRAFDSIRRNLAEEEVTRAVIQKKVLQRNSTLPFRKDDRYVPLIKTEEALRRALEDTTSPPVILLYGGPGEGKSTLARHLVLQYQTTIEDFSQQQGHSVSFEGSASRVFDQVIYLECGRQLDVVSKQFELRDKLGWDAAAGPLQEQDMVHSGFIRKSLSSLLKEKPILLVFDDLWNQDFLQQMVSLCGKGVKCLVTSQLGSLCVPLNFRTTAVRIEDIGPEDARRILAAHIGPGLKDRLIPKHVQGLADEIVESTSANPLAMACVATAIDFNRHEEVREWERAADQLIESPSELLDSKHATQIQCRRHPRSFWGAMRMAFEGLTKQEKHVMIFMSMCKGPTVPEEVVEFFYKQTKGSRSPQIFSRLRMELEWRQFIKIEDTNQKQKAWSIHSLHAQFIHEQMEGDKAGMFSSMYPGIFDLQSGIENEKDMEVTITKLLGALYLAEEFANEIIFRIGMQAEKFSVLRRNAIESVTRLLVKDAKHDWTFKLRVSTRQVFLSYICDGVMHEEGILHLFSSELSGVAMVDALNQLILIDSGIDYISVGERVIARILDFFEEKSSDHESASDQYMRNKACDLELPLNVAQCRALADLARGPVSGDGIICEIVRFPGILQKLVNCLDKRNDSSLQEEGALALVWLINAYTSKQILHIPRILEKLINAMTEDQNPFLQRCSVINLGRLANGNYAASSKICRMPGAIEWLVRLIEGGQTEELQTAAAETLYNLVENIFGSRKSEPELQKLIKTTDGLIESLASLLTRASEICLETDTEWFAIAALMLMDPTQGKKIRLRSPSAFLARGRAAMILGLYEDSLRDFNEAGRREPQNLDNFSCRCFLRAKMQDFEGALQDAESAVKIQGTQFNLREMGILKRMMGDLPGALMDLDDSLDFDPNDYQALKHRGYVKFLLNDEEGACADAEKAMRFRHSLVDAPGYEFRFFLGGSSVEYLNFKLR